MKHITKILFSLSVLLALNVTMRAQVMDFDGDRPGPPDGAERMEQKFAKKQKADKKQKIDTRKAMTYSTTAYMFCFSAQFGDSIVYMTEIQEVPNTQLTKKYDYLAFRSDYTYQFVNYLADSFGAQNQTGCVFYSLKKKKMQKKWTKMMNKYKVNKSLNVRVITSDKYQIKAQNVVI